MKESLKRIGVFFALLIPSYFLSAIGCMFLIYIYGTVTGAFNEAGAEGLPFLAIPVGFILAPVVSLMITYKLFK